MFQHAWIIFFNTSLLNLIVFENVLVKIYCLTRRIILNVLNFYIQTRLSVYFIAILDPVGFFLNLTIFLHNKDRRSTIFTEKIIYQ